MNIFQERFPPNIYYKIFTHRPIQDMCSNSPKDYTKAEVKLQMTRDKHNTTKTRPLPGPDSKLICASIVLKYRSQKGHFPCKKQATEAILAMELWDKS